MVSGILSKIVARFRSPEPPPRNWFYGSAAAILLLAAVLRLLRRFLEPFPVRDGIWYVQMAQEIAGSSWREAVSADAGGLLEFYPPLIFAVMAGGEHCGLGAENAGWVLVLTTGCLLPVAIALIARELFGDWRYTLGALLLASIMPPAVRMSGQLLRESPYWCFCGFALLFAIRAAAKKGWWNWGWYALFGSLATLTRREGVELLGVFLIFQVFWGWRNGSLPDILRRKLLVVVGVIAVFLALLLPVQFWLRQNGSHWEPFPLKNVRYIFQRFWRS